MKTKVICSLAILLLGLTIGCARAMSPVIPSEKGRSVQTFYTPLRLFFPFPEKRQAWDVDLATVVAGPDVPGYTPGDVWDMLTPLPPHEPWNYCAAVSLLRPSEVSAKAPRYSWLQSDHTYPVNNHRVVGAEDFACPDGACGCFKICDFPRCDACYFYNEDDPIHSTIELAVCYMIKGRYMAGPPELVDWDIAVTINT